MKPIVRFGPDGPRVWVPLNMQSREGATICPGDTIGWGSGENRIEIIVTAEDMFAIGATNVEILVSPGLPCEVEGLPDVSAMRSAEDARPATRAIGGADPERADLWGNMKPCPFCGCREPGAIYTEASMDKAAYGRCESCLTEGPEMPTEAEAVAAWNSRPASALRSALEDARSALESLPVYCLGEGHDVDQVWPLRDELVDKIKRALEAAS